ncbi:MAG: polysaccharide deacetylase family protein [Bacillota bacterium]
MDNNSESKKQIRAAISLFVIFILIITGCTATKLANDNKISVKEIGNGQGREGNAQESAVIAFTFDDGCITDYLLAYPILKKYAIKGTSYIISSYLDKKSTSRITWDMVKEMMAYGWVFGDHTYSHKDLETMSTEQIRQSMEAVDASFARQGLRPPAVAAYPYGSYDQRVIEAMKPYRKQIRKAYYQNKFVDLNHVKPYEIDSISADMETESQLLTREAIVDRAVKEKAVVVFRAHSMFREVKYDTGNFQIQTDSRLFEEFVQYCVEKGCRFITMEELMRMYS